MPASLPTLSIVGPNDTELSAKLGRSRSVWDVLIAAVEGAHAPVTREWHFTAKSGAWQLRLKQGARTILQLLPQDKYFLTAFVFGERAVMEILAGGFSNTIVTAIHQAAPYAEGRGIRLVTRNRRDVATILKLAVIKVTS